jgi:hypothetical protein
MIFLFAVDHQPMASPAVTAPSNVAFEVFCHHLRGKRRDFRAFAFSANAHDRRCID